VLPTSYHNVLHIAGQSRKRPTPRPEPETEPTEPAVPFVRSRLEPKDSSARSELTESELLEIVADYLAMLQARIPGFDIKVVIKSRQNAD
jgi:hypothetical protein